MIKSPIDQLIGFWRTMEMQHVEPDNPLMVFNTMLSLNWGYFNGTGLKIGDPPSVSGWPAYYQSPSFDKSWITTDSITRRAQRIDQVINGWAWIRDSDQRLGVDLVNYAESLANPEDPNLLIDQTVLLLFGLSIDQETHDYLKSILLSGQLSDSYWTNAWADYQYDQNDVNRQIVESRLKALIVAINHLGEFQLM